MSRPPANAVTRNPARPAAGSRIRLSVSAATRALLVSGAAGAGIAIDG